MINVVLVEPEIPQNTGNIARTCACTGCALHLVRPFGFEISDRTVKRAGLDYWDKVEIYYYDSLAEFMEKHSGDCYRMFGKETKGLPEDLIYADYDRAVRIPMIGQLRSLNLANSVAITLYESLRQHDFFGKDIKIKH